MIIQKFDHTRHDLQDADYKVLNSLTPNCLYAVFEIAAMLPGLKVMRIRLALNKLNLHGYVVKTNSRIINPATGQLMSQCKRTQ